MKKSLPLTPNDQKSQQSTPTYLLNLYQQTKTSIQHTKHSKKQLNLSKPHQFIHQNHHNQMSNLNERSQTGSLFPFGVVFSSYLEIFSLPFSIFFFVFHSCIFPCFLIWVHIFRYPLPNYLFSILWKIRF